MDIYSLARKDWKQFSQQIELTFTTPDGSQTVTVKGLISDHNLSIDPTDGRPVNSKSVHCSAREELLIEGNSNYPIRNTRGIVSMTGHKVSFENVNGVFNTYKIDEAFPNDTVGALIFILGLTNVS